MELESSNLDLALFHWAMAAKLFERAENDGFLPEGAKDYARLRRIALSRDLPFNDVVKVVEQIEELPVKSPK
jgi:hypothetical protein